MLFIEEEGCRAGEYQKTLIFYSNPEPVVLVIKSPLQGGYELPLGTREVGKREVRETGGTDRPSFRRLVRVPFSRICVYCLYCNTMFIIVSYYFVLLNIL